MTTLDTDYNIYNEDYYQTPDNYNDTTILQKYIINLIKEIK